MGVLQFLRECEVKRGGYVTMVADSTAGKSTAPRVGVLCVTMHIQVRFPYLQVFDASGEAQLRNVGDKDNLADLRNKYLSYLSELYKQRSSMDHFRIHAILHYINCVELLRQQDLCTIGSSDSVVAPSMVYYMKCFAPAACSTSP